MKVAKQDDWKTRPFPSATKELPFHREFNGMEMEQIKLGFVPAAMEDKWFIYYCNDVLNFHRSWVGSHIYELVFLKQDDRYTTEKAKVNCDPSEYNRFDDMYDIRLLNFLIDRLLLGKNVPFPPNESIDADKQAILKHNIVGYGRSNKEEE